MAVTFKWIIYVVVQRNSLPRHPSTIPRTFKLDSSEHILRAEAVGHHPRVSSSHLSRASEQNTLECIEHIRLEYFECLLWRTGQIMLDKVWLCAVSRRALRIGVVVGRFYSKIFSSFTYRARLSASFKLWSLTFMPKSLCFRVKITTKLSQKSFPPTNTISVSPFLFTTR